VVSHARDITLKALEKASSVRLGGCFCDTVPSSAHNANNVGNVSLSSERTNQAAHPKNIAYTLRYDARRAGGVAPLAKGGGGGVGPCSLAP
jgi:hypothetical protein